MATYGYQILKRQVEIVYKNVLNIIFLVCFVTIIVVGTLDFSVSSAENTHETRQVAKFVVFAAYRLADYLVLVDALRHYHDTFIPAILVVSDTATQGIQNMQKTSVIVLHKPVKYHLLENTINETLNYSVLL